MNEDTPRGLDERAAQAAAEDQLKDTAADTAAVPAADVAASDQAAQATDLPKGSKGKASGSSKASKSAKSTKSAKSSRARKSPEAAERTTERVLVDSDAPEQSPATPRQKAARAAKASGTAEAAPAATSRRKTTKAAKGASADDAAPVTASARQRAVEVAAAAESRRKEAEAASAAETAPVSAPLPRAAHEAAADDTVAMGAVPAISPDATQAMPQSQASAAPAPGVTKAFKMPPERGAEGRRSQRAQQPRYQQSPVRPNAVAPMQVTGESPVRPVEWGAHGTGRSKTRKKRSVPKILLLTLLSILCVVGLAYSGVALYFSDRFLPNTNIGKVDVSLMSAADAQKALSNSVSNYTLNISGMGFDRTLNATDMGLSVDTWDIVDTALSHQDSWRWIQEWEKRHDETDILVATTNEAGLAEAVRSLVISFNDTVKGPVDANLAYDSAKGAFLVTKESVGQALNPDAVIAAADEAIALLKPSVTLTEDDLLQPTVFSDDERLNTAAQEANAIVGSKLTFTLSDTEVAKLGSDELTQWITLGDDLKPTLRDEEVDAWAQDMADELNTIGKRRTYTRPDGKQFTVEGGTYGWEIETETLANQVKDILKGGEAVEQTLAIPTDSTGYDYTTPGGQDWGKRYLDIDLGEQHVRFYDDDGKLVWESDCISGTPDGEHDTSTGVFWLNKPESPSKLIGYDSNGEKEYETEVTYWMPFDGISIGLHDADWQTDGFGGEMYKEGYGSHGCVNLPKDKARELYGLIKYSDVVVSHY